MNDFTVTIAPGIIGDSMKAIGFDIARAAFKKQAEAMASIFRDAPQSAFATSLRKRRSHRDYCQVRAESIYGLKPTLAEVAALWAEKTTDIQDPLDQLQSSSLHCHGPPSGLVREHSTFFYSHAPMGRGQGEPQR